MGPLQYTHRAGQSVQLYSISKREENEVNKALDPVRSLFRQGACFPVPDNCVFKDEMLMNVLSLMDWPSALCL